MGRRADIIDAEMRPVPQVNIEPFRADLKLSATVLLEIDGEVKYVRDTVDVIKRESDRKKRIENWGYRILRYRPVDLLRNRAHFLRRCAVPVSATELSAQPT